MTLVDTWDAAPLDVFDPLDVLEAGSFRRKSLRDGKAVSTDDPRAPVFFMIGSQRSGSNWLRTMLNEREDLVSPSPSPLDPRP